MALVWVTGVSGSGKSSVCDLLKRHGHHAVDADWEGYCHWVNRATGEAVHDPPYPPPPRWLEAYAWRMSVQSVESLAKSTKSGVAFLCGSAENEADVRQYFDHVVCLTIDDATLRNRLRSRTTNAFGKHPDELQAALERNRRVKDQHRNSGATIIDATRPPDTVVRDVLKSVGLALGVWWER